MRRHAPSTSSEHSTSREVKIGRPNIPRAFHSPEPDQRSVPDQKSQDQRIEAMMPA